MVKTTLFKNNNNNQINNKIHHNWITAKTTWSHEKGQGLSALIWFDFGKQCQTDTFHNPGEGVAKKRLK